MEKADKDYLYNLGKKIFSLYREKYKSQNIFAQEVGCDNRTIRRIIRGEQNASIILLRKIAKTLDIDLAELLK